MATNRATGVSSVLSDYYYFYIFYKNQCIYCINLKKDDKEKQKAKEKGENEKLLLGSIYAINYLCMNIQPNRKLKNVYKTIESLNKGLNMHMTSNNTTIAKSDNNLHVGNFNSFNTPFYKLHYFETLTAYKFVMITHKNIPNLSNFLKDIYKTLFVESIILNPVYNIGDEIKDKTFDQKIFELIKSVSFV